MRTRRSPQTRCRGRIRQLPSNRMSDSPAEAGYFGATIWSTIIKARDGEESDRAAAMERLLVRYRQPIYRHILASLRGPHRSHENAEDLTQGFIAQCLRVEFLRGVDPAKGRFRTFVRECIRRYLRDRHVEAVAAKRGGGQLLASLDEVDEEGRKIHEPAGPVLSPEEAMDREWAVSVLEHAMEALKRDSDHKQLGLFEAVKGQLGRAASPGTSAEIAIRLGMKPGTVDVTIHRMRKRLGELIRAEVRETVANEEELRDELRYLIALLSH